MKYNTILLALALPFSAHAGELQLIMYSNALGGKNLFVAIHSSASDFPGKDEHAINRVVPATGDKTELSITDVPAGEYAVSVFADVNGNGKLDSNFIGIHQEPVGVSRDAKGHFGPPKFADAAFNVGEGITQQTIHIK